MGPATDKHQAPTHRLKFYIRAVIECEACLKRPLKKDQKLAFNSDYRLMQVKSKRAFCNAFYHFSLRPLFLLFMSGRFRQVLSVFDHDWNGTVSSKIYNTCKRR